MKITLKCILVTLSALRNCTIEINVITLKTTQFYQISILNFTYSSYTQYLELVFTLSSLGFICVFIHQPSYLKHIRCHNRELTVPKTMSRILLKMKNKVLLKHRLNKATPVRHISDISLRLIMLSYKQNQNLLNCVHVQ